MRSERTHVLLDLDGILSDSEPGYLRSLQWPLRKRVSQSHQRTSSVSHWASIWKYVFADQESSWTMTSNGVSHSHLLEMLRIYGRIRKPSLHPGMSKGSTPGRDGLSLAAATAKPEVTAHPILDYFDISDRFAVRRGDAHPRPACESRGHRVRARRTRYLG